MVEFDKKFESWKSMLLTPVPAIAAEAKKTKMTLHDGAENIGIALAITVLLMVVVRMIFSGFGSFPFFGLITIIFGIIGGFVASFIFAGAIYLMANALGGKTDFNRLYYMLSVVYAPIAVATAIVYVVAALPFAGMIAIVNLLIGLYGLYILTLAMQATYKFDTTKAVLTWLVPALIVFALMAFTGAAGYGMMGGYGNYGYGNYGMMRPY
jgi:hypothetical protein